MTKDYYNRPGTFLRDYFARFGFKEKPGCSCKYIQKNMDDKGTKWCEENKEFLVLKIRREAQRRGIPFSSVLLPRIISLAINKSKRKAKNPQ